MTRRRELINYGAVTGFACLVAALIVAGAVVMLRVPREPLALSAYLGIWAVLILFAFAGWGWWERRRELAEQRRELRGGEHGR